VSSGPVQFEPTSWTTVLAAQQGSEDEVRRCLDSLIERYWQPVYCFIRRSRRSPEDAADQTQQFFAEFVSHNAISYADRERGKFRTFLLASVRRFLAMQHRKDNRKRAVHTITGIEHAEQALRVAPSADESPAQAYERTWVKCVIDNAVARLHEECAAIKKDIQFRVFEARFLRGTEEAPDYAAVAAELGISETDVDNILRRAKRRFRRILQQEAADSTLTRTDAAEEIGFLLGFLSR
jgi:RNA polymerase sigma-70 factor (ECF subfamily)